jgi:hypothetical protein
VKKVLNMCTKTKNTIRFADQLCTDRISQPKDTLVVMNRTLSKALPSSGL